MSNTTSTQTVARPNVPTTGAAIAALYGIPVVESKETQAHLKAIKSADKAGLMAALAEHGAPLYRDPSALRADVDAASEFVRQGGAVADSAEAIAVRIVMTARQVQPSVSAVAIGRAVEGDAANSPAGRQRWSRYVAAAKATASRAEAIKAGKTTDNLSIRQALTALQNSYVPREEILRRAAEGEAMPSKAEADAAKAPKAEAPKPAAPVTGATFVERLTAVSDLSKRLQVSDLSADQRAEVARILTALAARLNVK